MGNDLEVAHGGAIAVDTMQLWTAAAGIAHQTRALWDVVAELTSVRHELRTIADRLAPEVLGLAGGAQFLAETTVEKLGALGHDLSRSAQEYEEVELRVRWQFAQLHSDEAALRDIQARAVALNIDVDTLGDEPSRLGERVSMLWEMAQQYVRPALLAGGPGAGLNALVAGAALNAMLGMIASLERGTVRVGGALGGAAKPVVVTEMRPAGLRGAQAGAGASASGSTNAGRTTAPSSLASLAGRIPNGTAQVAIERFAMPGGRTEWAVYVAGTRTSDMGGAEPWDMKSNTELYLGERSASSDAVLEAMRGAGIAPDQPVHLVGHSQGGMIAANVAMSGAFEVGSLTTFGSPVDAEVPDSVLSVRLRHSDDPVAALAGVGGAVGGGSSESVVVTRTGDPVPGLHDLGLPMHGLEAYARTAELYQSSGDVRVAAVDRLFTHLGTAESVTRTDYVAVRVQPVSG